MATISSLGSGSGLDLSGLLTSLMQAEQAPLTALQKKEASYQAKISAYGSLQSALSIPKSSAKPNGWKCVGKVLVAVIALLRVDSILTCQC